MKQLNLFLKEREGVGEFASNNRTSQEIPQHVHHTHKEHHRFENQMQEQLGNTRRIMLKFKQDEKKFKFNQPEYRVNRRQMISRVSRILRDRILHFMRHIVESTHDNEVREVSLSFKEDHYGPKKWDLQVPMSGFASIMPMFYSYNVDMHDQTFEDDLELAPSNFEIEKFIKRFMLCMNLETEVCLMSLIFIERLLKNGKV